MHVGDAGVFVGHKCLRPPSFREENFHRSPFGRVFGLTKRVFSLVLDPCILPVATWWCGAPTFGAAVGETTQYGWWARTPYHSSLGCKTKHVGTLHGCMIPGLSSRKMD